MKLRCQLSFDESQSITQQIRLCSRLDLAPHLQRLQVLACQLLFLSRRVLLVPAAALLVIAVLTSIIRHQSKHSEWHGFRRASANLPKNITKLQDISAANLTMLMLYECSIEHLFHYGA
jgi:hypothetical protein